MTKFQWNSENKQQIVAKVFCGFFFVFTHKNFKMYTSFGLSCILQKLTGWVVTTLSNTHEVGGSIHAKFSFFKQHTHKTNYLQRFPYNVALSAIMRWELVLYSTLQNRMAEGAAAVSPLQGVRVQIPPGCSLVGVGGSRKSNPLGLVGTPVIACLKGGRE